MGYGRLTDAPFSRLNGINLSQIEKQQLGPVMSGDREFALFAHGRAVALLKFHSIQTNGTARYLEPGMTSRLERMSDDLSGVQQSRVDPCILNDTPVPAVMCWTSPGRITEPFPILSRCSSAPVRT